MQTEEQFKGKIEKLLKKKIFHEAQASKYEAEIVRLSAERVNVELQSKFPPGTFLHFGHYFFKIFCLDKTYANRLTFRGNGFFYANERIAHVNYITVSLSDVDVEKITEDDYNAALKKAISELSDTLTCD